MSLELLNVFNQDAFGALALTRMVNDITPTYNRLGDLGLFTEEGVSQRLVGIDFDPTTNQLLPQSSWGGPGVANKTGRANTRGYNVPHFPVHDNVLAADIQGRRQPGTNMTLSMQVLVAKKMAEIKRKLEQTREWMRLGVLKAGLVKDGNGDTILDIYGDFGIAQDTTSLVLGAAGTDVAGKINTVKRKIDQALRGEMMTEYVSLCSDTFYDALTSHANVKAAFQYYTVNGQNLAGDYRVRGFRFGEVTWINYTGSVTDSKAAAQKMIADDEAYVFPLGTTVFREFLAPADYIETVNTDGLPFYAKQERMDFDKGIKIECQSNPLPFCAKPKVIQKVTV
jgi:hypothetical protein